MKNSAFFQLCLLHSWHWVLSTQTSQFGLIFLCHHTASWWFLSALLKIRMIFIMNWKAKNLLHTTFSRKMKEFRKQHVMESKFHSFWTKSKCRLKNFVAALNQFSQFVQCVQIVGARVFEVMFSVTTVCLVQGRSHFPFLLHQWRSLKPPPPRLYPVFISIPIPQAAAPGPRSNRRKKPPPATTSRW